MVCVDGLRGGVPIIWIADGAFLVFIPFPNFFSLEVFLHHPVFNSSITTAPGFLVLLVFWGPPTARNTQSPPPFDSHWKSKKKVQSTDWKSKKVNVSEIGEGG